MQIVTISAVTLTTSNLNIVPESWIVPSHPPAGCISLSASPDTEPLAVPVSMAPLGGCRTYP